jgi:hypothetical protein
MWVGILSTFFNIIMGDPKANYCRSPSSLFVSSWIIGNYDLAQQPFSDSRVL